MGNAYDTHIRMRKVLDQMVYPPEDPIANQASLPLRSQLGLPTLLAVARCDHGMGVRMAKQCSAVAMSK